MTASSGTPEIWGVISASPQACLRLCAAVGKKKRVGAGAGVPPTAEYLRSYMHA